MRIHIHIHVHIRILMPTQVVSPFLLLGSACAFVFVVVTIVAFASARTGKPALLTPAITWVRSKLGRQPTTPSTTSTAPLLPVATPATPEAETVGAAQRAMALISFATDLWAPIAIILYATN